MLRGQKKSLAANLYTWRSLEAKARSGFVVKKMSNGRVGRGSRESCDSSHPITMTQTHRLQSWKWGVCGVCVWCVCRHMLLMKVTLDPILYQY